MKKIFSLIMLFGALLLAGACSDNDKDEPDVDPVVNPDDPTTQPADTPEFPSEETFETEINNNLWVLEEDRYESEEGVEVPTDLFCFFSGGPDWPYQWYFWDNKVIMCNASMYGKLGIFSSPSHYDQTSGKLSWTASLHIGDKPVGPEWCQFMDLNDNTVTIKSYLMTFPDPGIWSDSESNEEWNSFPDKDKVINKAIYQVAKYRKVQNPDLKEALKDVDFSPFWNPDDFGIY